MIGAETIAVLKSQKLYMPRWKRHLSVFTDAFSVHPKGDDLFLETIMSMLYYTTMQEGVTIFFGHFHEHWPLANSSVINAALQLKRLPTPGLILLISEVRNFGRIHIRRAKLKWETHYYVIESWQIQTFFKLKIGLHHNLQLAVTRFYY